MITAGKSKGQTGKVRLVLENKIVVEGCNFVNKHVKGNPQQQKAGGIITKEAAVHISNVALVDPTTAKPGKVGFKFVEQEGGMRKVRYFRATGHQIDIL